MNPLNRVTWDAQPVNDNVATAELPGGLYLFTHHASDMVDCLHFCSSGPFLFIWSSTVVSRTLSDSHNE